MNTPSFIPGILDEYCWMHDSGGWKCETCWLEIHLVAFFEAVAIIASIKVGVLIQAAIETEEAAE